MMGTRSGDLDPGIILYLLNEKHFDARRLAELVNHQSGLLGVSGTSDMKTAARTKRYLTGCCVWRCRCFATSCESR